MSRYIDADALRKSALDLPNCYNGFSDTYDKSCIIDLIDEQPSVDVRPNVKGKWLSTFTGWIFCSECASEPPNESNYRSKFCPCCGTRMDGDTE